MKNYTLEWPADFEDYSWELESKGWFSGLLVIVNGKTFRPSFYDPVRLSQDIEEEIAAVGFFSEPSLIVVDRVCRESMVSAIAKLAKLGKLERIVSGR